MFVRWKKEKQWIFHKIYQYQSTAEMTEQN